MTNLVLNRDRDASDVIRGYVYQVELTILRWLNLQPSEQLELEGGEDIDLISQCKLTGNEQRLLEQVKNLSGAITLWSAVGVIANFVEHRQSNLNSNLRFLFTTTASITIERPSPRPLRRQPGILVWENLRQGEISSIPQADAVRGLRQILSKKSRPEKISTATWNIFDHFITTASDADLLELIRSFQWSTTAPKAEFLHPTIVNLLVERKYATNLAQAQPIYLRLFLYVIKLLAASREDITTRKILTTTQLNDELLSTTLDERDRALIENVVVQLCTLTSRVGTLEETVQQFPATIATQIQAQIQQQLQAQGFSGLNLEAQVLELEMPPLVERLSIRTETVTTFAAHLQQHAWVTVNGISGSGKTHLVALIIRHLGTNYVWLSLRNKNAEASTQFIHSALKSVAQVSDMLARVDIYHRACERLGKDAVIVLDDLPQLLGDEDCSRSLVQLMQVCQAHSVKLLSTSPYDLPISLQEAIHEDALYMSFAPNLSNSEAAEILLSYGMPSDLINSKTAILNTLAKGHPQLVTAIARYLQQHRWQIDDDLDEKLWRGEYQSPLNDQTVLRILRTVENENARELLYRLCVPVSSFSLAEVRAVAMVSPAIQRPYDQLSALVGLWVQQDVGERWQISPLVKPVGDCNLLTETKRTCHLALGELILTKQELSPLDVRYVIIHLVGADDCDRAGLILGGALQHLLDQDKLVDDDGILSFWFGAALPTNMTLGVRVLLRAYQIAARYRYGKSISPLLEDLDQLLEQVSEDNALMVVGAVGVLIANSFAPLGEEVLRAQRYLRIALRLLPFARIPDTQEPVFPDFTFISSTLWVTVTGIATPDQLSDWMTTVETLTPEQLHSAFSHEISERGCMIVTEELWRKEERKVLDQQDWQTILATYEDLAARSKHLSLDLLWAYIVRSQIIILGTHQQNLNAAVTIAESALEQASNDSRVYFVIAEAAGTQLARAGRSDQAVIWLGRALGNTMSALSEAHLRALLNMACATGHRDLSIATEFARQAVALAESSVDIDELLVVKALGELAIARWISGDQSSAFQSWDRACELLVACRSDDDEWKGFLMVFGHITGYFTSIAETGQPPSRNPGGESYVAPQLGILSNFSSQLGDYYRRDKECPFFVNLSRFAKAVGDQQRSLTWVVRGLDDARLTNQNIVFALTSLEMIPSLVQDYCFAEVLDMTLDAGAILVAGMYQHQGEQSSTDFVVDGFTVDVNSVLSEAQWSEAERRSVIIGLLPIVIQLGRLIVRDCEAAHRYRTEVVAMCRQISDDAHNPQLWLTAAELIEQLCSSSHDGVLRSSQQMDQDVLQCIGYLVASLQADTPLHMVIKEHFEIAQFVLEQLQIVTEARRQLIIPFFLEYWEEKFFAQPLSFDSTQLIGRMLTNINQLPETEQVPSLLLIMAYGLKVSIPQHVAQWIYNTASTMSRFIQSI